MKESMQLICDRLVRTLRCTRGLHTLMSLRYDKETEIVTATFEGGQAVRINVAADSGTAMIRDIMKALA